MRRVLAAWGLMVGLAVPSTSGAKPLVAPERPAPWRLTELPDGGGRILKPEMIAGVRVAPGSHVGVGFMATRQKDLLRLPGENGPGLKRRPSVGVKLNL